MMLMQRLVVCTLALALTSAAASAGDAESLAESEVDRNVTLTQQPAGDDVTTSRAIDKRHAVRSTASNLELHRNVRCPSRARGGGKCNNNNKGGKGASRGSATCKRRESKCRRKMSRRCRKNPRCSRRANRKCRKKFVKCRLGQMKNDRPRRPRHPPKQDSGADSNRSPAPTVQHVHAPTTPKKREKEECEQTSDCEVGLCCARHHPKRICKPFTKQGQICTRTFYRKRSPDKFERCPCELGLRCAESATRHHTCQSTAVDTT